MPLQRRLPKRGFRNPFRRTFTIVNLKELELRFEADAVVDPETLMARGLAKRGASIKVLGEGQLTKPLSVKAHAFSKSATASIAAAGGTTEVIERA